MKVRELKKIASVHVNDECCSRRLHKLTKKVSNTLKNLEAADYGTEVKAAEQRRL